MATVTEPLAADLTRLPEFRNEPGEDFSRPEVRQKYTAAVAAARRQLGQEYPCLIGWENRERKSGRTFKSLNPSKTSEVVGVHQDASAEMAREAVTAAAKVFECWGQTQPEKRIALVRRAAQLLRERKAEYTAWLTLETGKTFPEAAADVEETIDFAEYYARQAVRLFLQPPEMTQLPGERDELRYVPLGVGAVIPPWNFPSALMAGMTLSAVVCGNTVVLKPSSDSATVAAKFLEILDAAGFPPGVVNLVTGSGEVAGAALVEDPRIRFISFTGSKAVGLQVHERAAKTQPGQKWIKRTILEMGGKDSILVDEDADLDAAVEGVAVSAFGYQGQKCSACSRAIVHEKIYDRFLAQLVERAKQITVGPADDPANYMGPVINERAMKKIQEYIAIGKKEGRVALGGQPVPSGGYYIPPTIIADLPPTARLAQEEVFGPVLAVVKCKDFNDGLAIANNTEYGLTGAVFTRDPAKLERAKNEFFVGNLYLNRKCTGAMVGAHPFGGFNMSGSDSKAGGPDYLLLFTQAKAIGHKL
ncbi:MAG: L-glutamate gamma-semialdehyde dehydrogenase [Terriglobales bacterium]